MAVKPKFVAKLQPDIAPFITFPYKTLTRSILQILSYTPSLVALSQEI